MRSMRTQEDIMSTWKGPFDKPMVSICCITYNHELFIEDALEGFLAQETDFPIEIIIHDDASTDLTTEILREYVSAYPKLIKPVYQRVNQFSRGKRPFSLAAKYTIGEFIALCEGDDFWTEPKKLQTQIDFLVQNPTYSASTHQCIKYYQNQLHEPSMFSATKKSNWTLDDLMFGRKYHTASLVLRGDILRQNPLPEGIVSGDKAISFLLLTYGSINYFPSVMAVYRKNLGGVSSWVTAEMMSGDLKLIPWLENINQKFPVWKYKSIVHGTICSYPSKIRLRVAIRHYLFFLFYSFSYFPKNIKEVFFIAKKLLIRVKQGGYSGF